jgi:uridylate kinase
MEKIVLSLGGSVILSKDANASYLKKLAQMLLDVSTSYKLYIIVGGGMIAREYIQRGRELSFPEDVLDEIGVDITRVNAKILSHLLQIANVKIPTTTNKALKVTTPIVIMGGTSPGHSTDMVGAELTAKLHAQRYIIATNVDGVYDKDPNIYHDAVLLPEISIDQLITNFGTGWKTAGKNMVIDGPALKIIKQAKLSVSVVNGLKQEQLHKCICNQKFLGTQITV